MGSIESGKEKSNLELVRAEDKYRKNDWTVRESIGEEKNGKEKKSKPTLIRVEYSSGRVNRPIGRG